VIAMTSKLFASWFRSTLIYLFLITPFWLVFGTAYNIDFLLNVNHLIIGYFIVWLIFFLFELPDKSNKSKQSSNTNSKSQ
jgi:hypothetical protein